MTDYIIRRKARKVAVAYVNLPHSEEAVKKLLVPSLEARGVKTYEFLYPIDTKSFKDLALKMKNTQADIFVLNGFQNHLVFLVRALREQGLTVNQDILGSYDMIDAAQVLSSKETEKIRVIAPSFMVRPYTNRYSQWRDDFRDHFKKEPLYTHAYAYDLALLLGKLATLANDKTSSSELVELFDKVLTEGITGPLSFDQNGNIQTKVEVGRFESGVITKEDK
jgi:ABC-type branched-subunit amino acid transport system substrate-binding protein